MHSIVCTKYFEMVVMTVICLSSISLAAEDPVYEENPRNKVLQYMDYCFTGVFACEMLLKVRKSYQIFFYSKSKGALLEHTSRNVQG